MAKGITVTEYILSKQRERPEARGAFSAILSELTVAAKIIAQKVKRATLADDFDFVGAEGLDEEHFHKLVEFADGTIKNRVNHVGYIWRMASKNKTDLIRTPAKYATGDYILVFDPLAGKSNMDIHVMAGTIFSILKKQDIADLSEMANVLQPGYEQVAAGYFVYGPSTMMVYTTGTGVHGFTLEPTIGEFLLSHENIRIPEKGSTYSVNEGNYSFWDENVQDVVEYFKTPDTKSHRPYTLRYTGSFVADFHRNLLMGGIYLYPADDKDPKKREGKLMLTCEANPLAFVVEQAGGAASTGTERILDVDPEHLHQRVPVFIGSREDVRTAEDVFQGKR
jgi:fructose-1,6-bisphosphatase I